MAIGTVEHFTYWYDMTDVFGPGGLAPGHSHWLSWGPDDRFKDAAVTLTPLASTTVAGTPGAVTAMQVVTVADIHVTSLPVSIGPGFQTTESHVGANFTNSGSSAIHSFKVTMSLIRP